MRVLIAMMIVVPFCVLINDFIAMWVGAEYILPASVVVLLVMDLYIHFVHSVNVDFINAAGLFREDRDNEIVAAVLNITLSILGAKTIGLAGVLLGTVVSQMWFWFGRSYVVFKLCLQADKEDYLKYWLKNIVDGIALTVSIVFCAYLNSRLPIANGYLKFVCSGILCGGTLALCNFAKLIFLDGIVPPVAAVVCLTLLCTVILSQLIGGLLPVVAEKLKMDPAVMASPLITTIVDTTTLLVYFNIARTLLKI